MRTPPHGRDCLAGITRERKIEPARAAGVEAIEEDLPLAVLETAYESFLCSR